ncbi:MAG: hypothetical protein Q7T77_07740 [Sulfuricurvum sp.]|nr:hypothetical protein [Sulfuricurvum sp.]
MKKEFYWFNEHDIEQVALVEKEISNIIIEQNIVPCHTGALKIHLDITGELDTILDGNITCQCGKELLTFQGSADAKNLLIKKGTPC